MSDQEQEVVQKFDVRVTISSLGNERRVISFRGQTQEDAQGIVQTCSNAYNVIRINDSLLLTGSDGMIVIVNLSNTAFIEVQIVEV